MARKEDVAKAAEKLMNNQKNIRNIGIVAHIDHGKCVTGESQLQLSNGVNKRADELFEELKIGSPVVKETLNETVFDVSDKNYVIFSLNKKTGQIEKKSVQYAWKLKGGKTLKVKLRNGLTIETTPEHKFVTFNGIDFLDKAASDIQEGDNIVCPRELKTEALMDTKSEILKRISEKPIYARVSQALNDKIRNAEHLKQIAIKSNISKPALKENMKHCRHKTKFLLSVADSLSIPPSALYDEIELVFFRQGGKRSKNAKAMKLPQNFENFYYLVGLLFGDGSADKLVVGKPVLGEKFRTICMELGIKTTNRNYGYRTPEVSAGSKTLLAVMDALFIYPTGKKSHKIIVNDFLQASDSKNVAAFLRGYFDCDGTVERARSAVSITSVSQKMLIGLQLLLLRFGCMSTITQDTLYITGFSVGNFVRDIGFGLIEKHEKAVKLAESATGSQTLDLVPINQAAFETLRKNVSMSAISHHYYKYEKNNYKPTTKTFYSLTQKMAEKGIDTSVLQKINTKELAFIQVKEIKESFADIVYDFTIPDNHNFVAEGMFIHNTTMTDSLVAASGLMSEELAGRQLVMDFEDQEQARGITINAANISIVQTFEGQEYLINIIDTPGHVDFGGEVLRAMRAVDGVILVVDAVEGVMPQTETVLRQALKEYVRPVLFLNKVDRLVNELKVTQEQMQERFVKVIAQVNNLIKRNAPPGKEDEWTVKVQDGSVAFGSGYHKWAVNVDSIKKTGVGFKEVYDFCKNENQKELSKKSPLYSAILEMVLKHLPSPVTAQGYRAKVIWHGDIESEVGKGMLFCDKSKPVAMMVTDVTVDPHAGDIATGRIYSGTIRTGSKLKLIKADREINVQKVGIYMGPDFVQVTEVPSGNIAAIVGAKEIYSGMTLGTDEMAEFESFKSKMEPVITMSIEAKNTKDLPKLIEVIKQLTKEDPNLQASINPETGEHLISGMGELHLEVNQYRITQRHKIPIETSPPIVVYHETVTKSSPILESKSPNKHNKFKISVQLIPKEILEKMIDMGLKGKIRPKDKEIVLKLQECGFSNDVSKKVWYIHNHSVLIDATRGITALHEIKELVQQGFIDAMNEGPIAKEKCFGLSIKLEDATLHEDSIHRGPAQVLPAVSRGIYACILSADPILLEPKQTLAITVPESFMGAVSRELGTRRTQISEMRHEGDSTIIVAKAPVKELIGFSADIRGATEGRAIWTAEYAGYEPLPRELQKSTIAEIRKRKGLDPEPKPASHFLE